MQLIFFLCTVYFVVKTRAECLLIGKYYTWSSGNVPSMDQGNDFIRNKIENNCMFMVYRIGGTEASAVYDYLTGSKDRKKLMQRASGESGVYPPIPRVYDTFVNMTVAAIKEATFYTDMIPIKWPIVNKIANMIAPMSIRVVLYSVTPFDPVAGALQNPKSSWLYALSNKVVLVIAMFGITGPRQYHRTDSRMPRFKELKWIVPPQAYGSSIDNPPVGWGKNETWITALEKTKQKIQQIGHFDIALLACGSYGGPLQHYMYKANKSSVYLGGTLQNFFGIRGNRWGKWYDDNIRKHPEQASWWIDPDPEERPHYCDKVEDCPYHVKKRKPK